MSNELRYLMRPEEKAEFIEQLNLIKSQISAVKIEMFFKPRSPVISGKRNAIAWVDKMIARIESESGHIESLEQSHDWYE